MQVLKKFGIAGGALAVAAVSIALAATPASADTGAQPGDAVGVGSDTVQNAADFIFDGAPGVAGAYNSLGNVNRVDNVFSTGDANGRTAYDGTCGATSTATGLGGFCSTTNGGAPNILSPSVILRAGTKPVVRPNGSGGGIGALIADASGSSGSGNYKNLPNDSISFARASRLPKGSEESSCDLDTSGCNGLHVIQFATDDLGVARVSTGFNGPAGLTAQTLDKIFVTCEYTKWNQIPGNSGGSSDTIEPIVPPSTSGTGSFFLADLNAATGGSATGYGSCTTTAQEHDPTAIYSAPTPGDAIEPFSKGKLALINNGYYINGTAYSGTTAADGAFTPNYLKLESGATAGQTGGDNNNYASTRGLYFVVRQTDYTSTTPFQTGSSDNMVQALFTDSASAIRSSVGRSEITAAGFTPQYSNCGVDPTSPADCA